MKKKRRLTRADHMMALVAKNLAQALQDNEALAAEVRRLEAEYARMSRVAKQIADGSGCCNCRSIANEFAAIGGQTEKKA